MNFNQWVNPVRRAEKVHMKNLGIKTRKAYRKFQKKQRRAAI